MPFFIEEHCIAAQLGGQSGELLVREMQF